MMPLAINENDMSGLAHGVVVALPLIVPMVVLAGVGLFIVVFGWRG
jgi:hypothetical protein